VLIDHPPANRPPGKLRDQTRRPVKRRDQPLRIDPPLEAEGGIRSHAERPRGPADGCGIEIGAFQQDRLGVVLDFGVETAHHPADGNRFHPVTDHQRVGLQDALLFVKRYKDFPGTGTADDDPALFEETKIECMQRLSQFHHHEIGHIHDIVDRAQADGLQPASHPERRRCDPDISDDSGRVAGAKIGVVDGNRGQAPDILVRFFHGKGGIP